MISKDNATIWLAIILSLYGCSKDPLAPSGSSMVHTGEIIEVVRDGILVSGKVELKGDNIPLDHGFIWSEEKASQIDIHPHLSLGKIQESGVFTAKLETSVVVNSSYWLRAYIRLESGVIYGNPVPFVSQGGKAPIIESFSPLIASWGDQIHIRGDNFSLDSSQNTISLPQGSSRFLTEFRIDSVSKTDIWLTITDPGVNTYLGPINISVYGKTATSQDSFRINGPLVREITPRQGIPGTKITLRGEDFTDPPLLNTDIFGVGYSDDSLNAHYFTPNILSISEDSIVFECPDLEGKSGAISFAITGVIPNDGVRRSYAPFPFELKEPEITDFFPKSFAGGDEVTIIGKQLNFPVQGGPQILFRDGTNIDFRAGTVTSITAEEIRFIVPHSVGMSSGQLYLRYGPYETISSQTFQFMSPWKWEGSMALGARCNMANFQIGDKIYLGAGNQSPDNNTLSDFWEYDFPSKQWSKKADFGFPQKKDMSSFVVDGKGYYGLGTDNGNQFSPNIYEYDPTTNTWNFKTSFPSNNPLLEPGILVADNHVYFIGGFESPDTKRSSVWRYEPQNDLWTQMNDFPYGGTAQGVAISIDNQHFYGLALITNTWPSTSLFQYFPDTDTWISRQQAPQTIYNPQALVFDGKAYVGLGTSNRLISYNPLSNSWDTEADFSVKDGMNQSLIHPREFFGAEYQGVGYLFGGQMDNTCSSNMISYTP